MDNHVFISYGHPQDSPYAERLAAYLTAAGVPVWYDNKIVPGNRWTRTIQNKIDTCAAFIVVMTPDAEESDWVEIEIAQARLMRRPILPLLLRGHRFFTLANIQYQDVSDDRLPGPAFIARLRELVLAPHEGPAKVVTSRGSSKNYIFVDLQDFPGVPAELRIVATESLKAADFLDEIWFMIADYAAPFTYGKTWILKTSTSGLELMDERIRGRTAQNIAWASDRRTIRDFGILPGMKLIAVNLEP